MSNHLSTEDRDNLAIAAERIVALLDGRPEEATALELAEYLERVELLVGFVRANALRAADGVEPAVMSASMRRKLAE